MQLLDAELTEGAKYRGDLLKWKLLAIGAIGSAGLGFQKPDSSFSAWVFCLAPFLCAYIDLLYRNSCIRREVVRSFIMAPDSQVDATVRGFVAYEQRSREKRYGLSFEAAAVLWSSVVVSLLVVIVPWVLPSPVDSLTRGLWWSGGIGCVLALLIEGLYWVWWRQPE